MNSEFYENIEEIRAYQKKQTIISYLRMAVSMVTLIAVIIALILFVPRTLNILEHFDTTLSNIDGMVSDTGDIVSSVKDATGSENGFSSEDMEDMAEVIQKINSIDFDKLNESINSLSEVVTGLSRITSIFGR